MIFGLQEMNKDITYNCKNSKIKMEASNKLEEFT